MRRRRAQRAADATAQGKTPQTEDRNHTGAWSKSGCGGSSDICLACSANPKQSIWQPNECDRCKCTSNLRRALSKQALEQKSRKNEKTFLMPALFVELIRQNFLASNYLYIMCAVFTYLIFLFISRGSSQTKQADQAGTK